MTVGELSVIPFFFDVSSELLASVASQILTRTFLHGECLLSSGSAANEVFLILHGNVCIERDSAFLVTRGQHELLGEQALLTDGGVRTATAKAQGLVTALAIPRGVFDVLLGDPVFSRNLASTLSKKLTQATLDRAYRYSKEALVFGEFRAHVAPEVLDRLIQEGTDYCSPRKTQVVILFSDIRGFTELSSDLEPERIARDLTTYLNHVVDIVHRYGGMVDKFVGDAVMAVWGAFDPISPLYSQQAFECAQRMVQDAKTFSFGGKPINIGVGLNAGTVFVGNVGGNGKRQFTVLGSAVNLASRFEAKSKELGQPIVLGEGVVQGLTPNARALLRDEGDIEVKGAPPQHLYTFAPSWG
jgi:class 3 adenylate cyclase